MGHPRLSVMSRDPHAEHIGSLCAQVIDPVICDYRFESREGRNAGQGPGLRSSDHRLLRTRLILSRLAVNDGDEAPVRG